MHSNTIPFKQPSMIWLNLSIDCIRVYNHVRYGCAILVIMINYALDNTSSKQDVLTQCWFDFGPSSSTLAQHKIIIGSTYHVCCVLFSTDFCSWQDWECWVWQPPWENERVHPGDGSHRRRAEPGESPYTVFAADFNPNNSVIFPYKPWRPKGFLNLKSLKML